MSKLFHTKAAMLTVAVLLATGLAGCGGSSDDNSSNFPTPPSPAPTPVPVNDPFFTFLTSVVGDMLDTAEPFSVDNTSTTSPESTEPDPLP